MPRPLSPLISPSTTLACDSSDFDGPQDAQPKGPSGDEASSAPKVVSSNWSAGLARDLGSQEEEFSSWLEDRLAREKRVFVERMKDVLMQQLEVHHKGLLEHLEQADPFYRPALKQRGSGGSNTLYSSTQDLLQSQSSKQANSLVGGGGLWAGVMSTLTTAKSDGGEKEYKSSYIQDLSHAISMPQRSVRSHKVRPLARLEQLVMSHQFELASCFLILLNVVVMSSEVQFMGCQLSKELNHPDNSHEACSGLLEKPYLQTVFTALAVLFSSLFTLEFTLRLLVLKQEALFSGWMWFDLLVLVCGVTDTIGRLGPSVKLDINPTNMRTARIARVLRMVKVFRGRETFHTLFLLMKSILASKHALGWSLLILYCTMTCVGLLINQLLFSYLSNGSVDESLRHEVFEYFGTYTRMLITMFEITLGNWAPPTRLLMSHVSQWWGLLIVFYRCIFCFSLVNVTAAVFITETNRVASDDEVQMMRKQRTDQKTGMLLTEVFNEIDSSNDGVITLSELRMALRDKIMRRILEILELDINDMEQLYAAMDDGSGSVSQHVFIRALLEMRGQAKTSKLVAVSQMIRSLEAKMDHLSTELSQALRRGRPPRRISSPHPEAS